MRPEPYKRRRGGRGGGPKSGPATGTAHKSHRPRVEAQAPVDDSILRAEVESGEEDKEQGRREGEEDAGCDWKQFEESEMGATTGTSESTTLPNDFNLLADLTENIAHFAHFRFDDEDFGIPFQEDSELLQLDLNAIATTIGKLPLHVRIGVSRTTLFPETVPVHYGPPDSLPLSSTTLATSTSTHSSLAPTQQPTTRVPALSVTPRGPAVVSMDTVLGSGPAIKNEPSQSQVPPVTPTTTTTTTTTPAAATTDSAMPPGLAALEADLDALLDI